MKKLLLSFLLFTCCQFLKAQDIDAVTAIQLVGKNIDATGMTYEHLANSMVSNAYKNNVAGTDMVYLQQMYKGLPVFNQLHAMAFKNGVLVSNAGSRIWDIAEKSHHASERPSIGAADAVRTAMQEKKINSTGLLIPGELIQGRKFDFGKPGAFIENITAELMWVPIHHGEEVRLAWQVYLVPQTSSDYWLIRVDANTNQVIDENNLTVYCKIHPSEPNHHCEQGKNGFEKISNQDISSSASVSTIKDVQSIFRINAGPTSPSIVNNASYRVIPFPAESPKHPGGTHALVSNPWDAAPGNATSLKWHSNGTTDYTITRGNNVWAKEDLAANNSTNGQPATSTTSPDPLTFNFVPNFTAPPTQTSPVQNQQFNITNLFYWNNIIHDILYLYGFDEASGNFQANNQGRGGSGNDFVLADAQDGNFIAPNQNNANFSTPPDGSSGRMQMYLWNASPGFFVNSPSTIAGSYSSVESNLSANNKLANVGPVTGDVVRYIDNAGGLNEGCVPPSNSLTGKIALINRGNCEFVVKIKNAQNAGAIAVIMINNVPGSAITMGGTDNTITIPAVMITDTDGAIMIAQLNNGLNVTLAAGQNMDGDVDNGIIVHEFSHGISNRLVGGPNQASCVSNAEQMGEGISDYYALMLTQDWANSNINSGFTQRRGIGTYAIGQSPSGLGIRTKYYCTDFAVNDLVYAASIPAAQHDRGEIWCATLWDMTWNIIKQTNSIAPSIYNSSSIAGNVIALKLVTEGLKLQPCNSGFIDARNAILRADSILYNGQYSCAIREAFRRRGMGERASQGAATNVNDQVADFTPYVSMVVNESVTQIPEGQNITFTTVLSSCSPITNFVLRDTLPTNVTYVNGGIYDAVNRVVSFPVNFSEGGTQSFAFTVTVNNGSYFAPQILLNEQVTGTTIPSTFTANSTTTNVWSVSTAQSSSPPNSFFTPNAAVASDQRLETAASIAMGTGTSSLSFNHRFITQAGFDGGVVEVSTDNGTTWLDITNRIVAGYYTGTLSAGSGTPLPSRQAWTGNVNTFITSSINMSGYESQNIRFRFRFGSNNTTGGTGWYVDDILLKREAVVNIRSSLFNATNTRLIYRDTVAVIVETPSCTSIAITSQPSNASVCTGTNASFTVTANGTSPTYQWQVSTDGGGTYSNIAGATSPTLTLTAVTTGMNNNRYRVLINNTCPSNATSNAAILNVSDPANISNQPANNTVCEGESASFSVTATGNNNSYQWQVSTDGGVTFINITGATSNTLTLTGVTAAFNANRYRVVIGSCSPNAINSNSVTLTVNSGASITTQPANTPACTGGNATINVTASGTAISYQWQLSTDGGATFSNIPGATTATLNLTGVSSSMNNNRYRVIISNSCTSNLTSNAVILTVSDPASINTQPDATTVCAGSNASFTVAAAGTNITYQWQVSTDGGTTFTDISGATSTTLTLTSVTAAQNNNRYRVVVFSCSPNGLNSTAAILTVNALAIINTQPANVNACTGSDATFSVSATGTSVNYQWQVSTDGGTTFTNITGANNATLTLTAVTAGMSGNRYRVSVSNLCTTAFTSAAGILTVADAANISTQPSGTTACEGTNAVFSAIASGISYQWQVSTDGGTTFTNISGATGQTLNLPNVTVSMNNNQYRLAVTGCTSSPVNSNAATLTVTSQVNIGTQPANTSVCDGSNASFTITASGASPAYQWQVSTDGGSTFTNITGATSPTLNLTGVTLAMNNNRYRATVSNSCTSGINSNAATLTVTAQSAIVSQPAPTSACPGSSASFNVGATGPGLTYQWQVSADGGSTFTNMNGETGSTLTLSSVTASMNNNRYRVVVTGSCSATGTTSNAAVLTVLPTATISQQPANVSGCAGTDVSFSVTATGTITGYQWQVSTDGGNIFTNISGETGSTLSLLNINSSLHNNRYRVVITATPCGTTSEAALLTVSPSPAVTISASPYMNLYPGLTTTLTASSNPQASNYIWFKNGVILPGETGSTITVQYQDLGIYSASDPNGCSNSSNQLTIADSSVNTVFIFPNPNYGQFQVRYYAEGNSPQVRIISMYDAKGSRVYSKAFTVTLAYERMDVDIRNLSKGVYIVNLSDKNGKRLATGKVIKH